MAEIRALLNPAPELDGSSLSDTDHSSNMRFCTPDYSPGNPARKKQKVCKDAAVFVRGKIQGKCRFPPHEYQDNALAAQHKRFEMYPIGEIADFPRHIPYNSEKKLFQERTGRESLEVFQYCFKVPGDSTQYAMLWDYNIGLVRTTPLFKCTGHSKTTPAKMLNRNPGLREICHSITGGALVAQGYWMPYEAAKAIAATFCWEIRYALTPVFGVEFPDLCIPPDSDKYGDMIIDPEITKHCTTQADKYRRMEECPSSRASSATPSPLTPETPTYPRHIKHFRLKAPRLVASASPSDASSEYSYSPSLTPEPRYRSLWTPANTPRSVPRSAPGPPSPSDLTSRNCHAHPSPPPPGDPFPPGLLPQSRDSEELAAAHNDDDGDDNGSAHHTTGQDVEAKDSPTDVPMNDLHAARMLMELKLRAQIHGEGSEARHTCRARKRRASA